MISGRVINKEIDENGNIRVTTEYTLTDGSKRIGNTRYAFHNYTPEKVAEDVKEHCETLIKKVYTLKRHQELIAQPLPPIEYQCTSAELTIKGPVKDREGNILTPAETIIVDDK